MRRLRAIKKPLRVRAYIDIDGVLIRKGKRGPELIPRFHRIISFLKANFDCYWLTTHARHGSGTSGVTAKMAPFLKKSRIDPAVLDGIRPAEWETLKTGAIDFSRPFIWLEDAPLLAELQELRYRGCSESLVEVDWSVRSMRLTVRRLKRIQRSVDKGPRAR